MTRELSDDLTPLGDMLMGLGQTVMTSLNDCVEALAERDLGHVENIRLREAGIDRVFGGIQAECRRILEDPPSPGMNLRYVLRSLKIASDLERLADECDEVAQDVHALSHADLAAAVPTGLIGQAKVVRGMVREAMRALQQSDAEAARSVVARDEEADLQHAQIYRETREKLVGRRDLVDELIVCQRMSRALERIGDHAVNIAEDVLFIVGQPNRCGRT